MFCLENHIVPHFYELDEKIRDTTFWDNDAATTFFQIYSFLRSYQRFFTHYNLTTTNILLSYIPDHYFNYIYKENNKTIVKFSSPYLIKIFDFSDSVLSGVLVIENLYKTINENKRIANNNGYKNLIKNLQKGINTSQDLSLIYFMRRELNSVKIPKGIAEILKSVSYGQQAKNDPSIQSINNIEDFYHRLLKYLKDLNRFPLRQYRNPSTLYGTFTIHTDICAIPDDITKRSCEFQRNI